MTFFISIIVFVVAVALIENSGLRVPWLHTTLFLVLWLTAGMSGGFGVDYPAYLEAYNSPGLSIEQSFEPVWVLLANGLRGLGFASRAWFMVTELAIMGLFFVGFRRMSPNFTLSVVLFVLCGFFFEALNGIRQYVAIAILFAAFNWVIEGKLWKYLIAVVVAAQFHASAWLILPLIFVVKIKWRPWMLALMLAATFVLGTRMMHMMLNVIGGLLSYGSYLDNDFWFVGGIQSGLLKIFLNLSACAAILLLRRVRRLNERNYLYVNAFVMSIVIYNVFYTFQPGLRLYWYFYPLVCILLPMVLRSFTWHSRMIIVIAFSAMYFALTQRLLFSLGDRDYGFDLKLF